MTPKVTAKTKPQKRWNRATFTAAFLPRSRRKSRHARGVASIRGAGLLWETATSVHLGMGTSMVSGLEHLVSEGIIAEVLGRLQSGKEAEVFVVRYGGRAVVAKVYKD